MKKVKLKQVLKQYRNTHWIDNNKSYRQVTISQTGEVSFRGEKHGIKIGRKRQFLIDLKEHPNTLIFIRQGVMKGGIGICPPEVDGCVVTENMPMFEIIGIEPYYLVNYIHSPMFQEEVGKLVPTGTAQKAIHERQLLEIEIPIPPIQKQKQIVDKINSIKNEIQQLELNITYDKELLSSLRQSILQEAVQGKLVKQNPDDGPASELPKKIQKEKEKLVKEGKIKKQKPLPPIEEDEIPYELPRDWVWCRLGDLSACENYSFVDGPFGSNLKKQHYVETGIRIIQLQNIGDDGIWKEGRNVYTSEKKADELIRCNAYPGNLVIAKMAPAGRTTIIPKLHQRYVLCSDCVKLKPYNKIDLYYIKYLMNSHIMRKLILGDSTGITRQRTSLGKLRLLPVPLPPLPEQKRIVEKVDKLMAFCDELEGKVKANKASSEALMGAVLRESFNAY